MNIKQWLETLGLANSGDVDEAIKWAFVAMYLKGIEESQEPDVEQASYESSKQFYW